MNTKIAVQTTSGKAYYKLVSELKKRKIPFITVTPDEDVPIDIEVVITTNSENSKLGSYIVLKYDENMDPSIIINEALEISRGKNRYSNLVIGVDPGKDFGIAVIGDGTILHTESVSSEEEASVEVLRMTSRYEADRKIVKIGNGAAAYRLGLISMLDRVLPQDVDIESVEERGTTKNISIASTRRNFKDASSAIKISMRKGLKIQRNNNE